MDSDLYYLIRQAHVSEKASLMNQEYNQYVFQVQKTATKTQIKHLIEKIYSVKVKAVRMVNVRGSIVRNRKGVGKRSDMKKAYVSLAEGQNINLETASK